MSDVSIPKSANPGPLGLSAFALTTLLLSSINAGLIPGDSAGLIAVVVPLAFAYGGLTQLIAGIMEYRNNNTFGTLAFTSYGAFWCWFALLHWTVGAGWLKTPVVGAVGVTLVLWGVFTFGLWVCTFKSNRAIWFVFLFLWVTFFLLGAGDLGAGENFKHMGGYLGIVTGLIALYVGMAEVTNATYGKTVLPLGAPILQERLEVREPVHA